MITFISQLTAYRIGNAFQKALSVANRSFIA